MKNISRSIGVFSLSANDILLLPEEVLPTSIAESAAAAALPKERSNGRAAQLSGSS